MRSRSASHSDWARAGLWVGALLLPYMAGCASVAVPPFAVADLSARVPARLAVLPFENETVSLRGPDVLRALVALKLTESGYGVLPASDVDHRLRKIGITDGGQLKAYTPQQIKDALEVEGLLYGTLEEYAYQNVGFLLRRVVRLKVSLIEGKGGDRLWESTGMGTTSRVALDKKAAEKLFVEGVVEQAAEGILHSPLTFESRTAVDRLFASFPRRN